MIGDPSGKSEERNLLSVEQLRAQRRRHRASRCAASSTSTRPERRAARSTTSTGCGRFSYLEFLRDVGKNFPGQRDARQGLGERPARSATDAGMSYTEFSYMLLQAYDFVHLYDKHGCELQVGGSDQWGNITAGIDLGPADARRAALRPDLPAAHQDRRHEDGQDREAAPSGSRPSGPARTQFYQYWINVDDADVGNVPAVAHRAAARGDRSARRRRAQQTPPRATARRAWPRS